MIKVYGLIGETLGHSISPEIHESICNKAGLQGKYNLFNVKKERLRDAVPGLKALGIKGANVTIPYKVDIIEFLDDIMSEARNIGAVNTIVIKDDSAMGYNTDYYGFEFTLEKYRIEPKGGTAVILGTGGASRAITECLINHWAGKIIFVSTNKERAKEKYRDFEIISYNEIGRIKAADTLINCTPVGMYPHIEDSPLKDINIDKFGVVIDLIYNPEETRLLKDAAAKGIPGINGLYMLIGQAYKAQELWNEMNLDTGIIEQVYGEMSEVQKP